MQPSITCKGDLLALEKGARQDDPSDALDTIESLMDQINTPQILSGDALIRHFLGTTLVRVVAALLKRSEVDEEVESRVFNFLEATLRFIVKTLDSGFDPLLTLLLEIFSEQNNFYMTSSGVGACEEIPEISDGAGADIFNDGSLIQEAIFVDPAAPSHPEYSVRNNNLARFFANINVFGRNAGFRELKNELEKTTPPPTIARIRAILAPVYEIRDFLAIDFLVWFTSVGERVFEMIMGMSDEDLKNDYRAASDSILYMSTLYRYTDRQDGAKEADMRRLQFALKGFRSPFLERRLNSLNDMNDILESLDVKDSVRDEEFGPFWVTKEFMCQWLGEHRILESIFTRNLHLEILKRSYRVMTFLAANDRLSKEDISMIWDVAAGKHETIQKNIYDLLLSITRFVKPETLRFMLDLIKCLQHVSYTSQHVEMLRMISSFLVTWGAKKQLDYQFLGLEILWDLVQDDVRFSQPDLHTFALSVLVEVLEANECRSIRGEYFSKCVQNLTRHKSVPQCLAVMNKLISSLAPKRKKPESEWSTFDSVKDEQELLQLAVDDLVIYQTKASTLAQAQGLSDRQVLTTVFDGLYSHTDQLDRRQIFITNLLERHDVSLSFELVGVLWKTLVCQALSRSLQDFALRWLEQIFSSQWTRHAISECAEQFFLEVICRQGVANLSELGFSLFRCLLKLVNWKRTWLTEVQTPNHGTQLVVTNFELIGMQCLWDIAVVANSDIVAGQAIAVLNELYQNLATSLQDRVSEKREEYVKNCMHHMLQAAKELQKVDVSNRTYEIRMCRCIRLLKAMLSEFESKASANGSSVSIRKHGLRLRGEQISLRLQRFNADGNKDLPRVRVYSNSTLSFLRREIAKILNDDVARLRLIARGAELKDDFKTIADLKLADGETVHLISRPAGGVMEREDMDMESEGRSGPNLQGGKRDSDVVSVSKDEELKVPHYVVSRIYFDEIFKMLDSAPQFITSQLWDLLMTLPTNSRILNEIKNLGSSWSTSLHSQSVYGLLYSLQVVESLLDESAVHGGQWASVFIENGGLEGLLDVMLSERFASPDSVQGSECLALLLKLISVLTVGENRGRSGKGKGDGIALLASFLKSVKSLDVFIHRLMNILLDSARAFSERQSIPSLDAGREKVGSFAMDLLTACALESPHALASIYRFQSFDQWIRQVLLHNGSSSLRQELARCILQIAQGGGREVGTALSSAMSELGPTTATVHPRIFFLDQILPLIRELASNSKAYQSISHRCTDLFGLANELLRLSSKGVDTAIAQPAERPWHDLLNPKLDVVAVSLTESLIACSIMEERNGSKEDHILIGVLRTLQSFVSLRPELRLRLGSSSGMNLVQHVFVDCLFSVPTVENHQVDGPPKCKLQRSRVAAYDLLLCLVDDCAETYSELLGLLLQQYARRELRSLHFYQPSQMDKAPCGYVGLRNLGATCYMNSLLQQLFLIPELRAAILQVPIVEEDKSNSLMYQLQALFGFLQESERQYYETKDLCHAYRDYDGLPVNTSQQMDVDEYFNMLFDKLEKCLKGTPQERILQDCFGGKVVNQIICKEPVRVGDQVFGVDNPFKSEREEKFFTLQLEVKHKRNIMESLELFVEGEMLEGDNKYFCEEANQRVDAMKRVCIKELPRTLILHLKRFEFDLDFMKKVKVNDCCEFPTCLNMHPYTLDGIEQREKAMSEAARHGLDPAAALDQIRSPDDCMYELVGVLVHTGTADSGHYYSYIKERVARDESDAMSKREGSWFLFNDTHVELFDDKEIGAACYGGNEYVQQMDAQQRPKCVPRSYNAYMLFYERISTAASPDRVKVGLNSKIRVPLPDEIMKGVWTENLQFLKDKQQYDATFFAFIYNFCSLGASVHAVIGQDLPATNKAVVRKHTASSLATSRQTLVDEGFRVIQLSILFVMNVLIHSWDTSQIESWVALIKSLLTPERKQGLDWVLDVFSYDVQENDIFISSHWLREALLHCRVPEARSQLLSLLLHIVQLLGPFERNSKRGMDDETSVPYCESAITSPDGRPLDEIATAESVRLHPLLTDSPYPRMYRGGWDPAVEPPDDYIPFPRAYTHVGKFLDKALNLLPDLPPHWRHFGEYFKLLAGVAEIGQEERHFLLSRRTIARCIDLFLNEESQFANHRKHCNRMGDKFSVPNFTPMMDLICLLVRCTTPLETDEEFEDMVCPTQLPIAGELDTACAKMLSCKNFLAKALLEGGNAIAVQTLFVHLAWFSAQKSHDLIQIVCEGIEECHEEEVQAMLDLLAMIVAIPDGALAFRIEKFVHSFIHLLMDVLSYPDIFKRCIDFLCNMVAHREQVRQQVVRFLYPPLKRREPGRWLECWLIKTDNEVCRTAAQTLACVLALPSAHPRRSEPPTTPQGISYPIDSQSRMTTSDKGEVDADALVESDELSHAVFEILLAAVPHFSVLVQAVDTCRPMTTSRLVMLFRAINFIVREAAGDAFLKRLHTSLPDFLAALEAMNDYRAEMDYNRAELYKLLLVAAQRSDLIREQITSDPKWREALIQNPLCSLTGKLQKANAAYNRLNLPPFFRLIKECCVQSFQFAEAYFSSQHCTWALSQVVCMSSRHTDSAVILLETFDVALDWERRGRGPSSLDKVRQVLLDSLLRRRQLLTVPEHCIQLLEKIIFGSLEAADIVDEIMMLVEGNHFELLVNSARGNSDGSSLQRTAELARQSAIRILDQVFEKLKLLERKQHDPQIESDVLKAMQPCDCMGLATSLLKGLMSPQLSTSARQVQLNLLSSLCKCDDEVPVACASELLRAYEAAALEPMEDVMATRQERCAARKQSLQSQAATKRPVRSKAKNDSSKKIGAASAEAERAAGRVSDIWNSHRGPKGFEECDDAFFEFVLVICSDCLQIALHSKDELLAERAFKLCICGALDSLEGSRTKLSELMQFIVDSGVSDVGRETVEAGPASSKQRQAHEEDDPWLRTVLKSGALSHNYSEALAVRLLLVYKDLLADPVIEKAVSGLLSFAILSWTAKQTSFACTTVISDLSAASESIFSNTLAGAAVGTGRGRSSLRSSANSRDSVIADTLLRELRPLAVMASVDPLLLELVQTGADRECSNTVLRALDAANVNRSNADTEQKCEEINQILAQLSAAAQAVRDR